MLIKTEIELDAVIVGAGFSGLHMLNKLRREGFKVKIYEAANDLGGTWFSNCYPGARADCGNPTYQFSEEDIWKDFEWKERFPGYEELREYFRHVDKRLDLSKDIVYNTNVEAAEFCKYQHRWQVTSMRDGVSTKTSAQYLILCTGFASKKYTPTFKGLEDFEGQWYHTSSWPKDGVDLKGKRVAVIGTGASGVQVIQEVGPEVAHLTVYQRTPNLALPMQQCSRNDKTQRVKPPAWKFPEKDDYPSIFKYMRTTWGAMDMDLVPGNALDATPEERRIFYEGLYEKGGFSFSAATYQDILFVKEANDTAYDFWCEKTRARINDPAKKDILAPKIPPHPIGTKRLSLEQQYFEVYNQDNVDIINIRESPIIEITHKGIKTEKEGVTEIDAIVFATGFDAVSGGILNIQIQNGNGESLQDKWKNGIGTNLGMTTAGFPNFFFLYGPQAPTAFTNGPTCSEIQGDWITELIVKIRNQGSTVVDCTVVAEERWKQCVRSIWNRSLFVGTDSWWQGANIPGKVREPLCYLGGIPNYISALKECASNDYDGFIFA